MAASRKKRLLGNHQRCWIWGRHAVLEVCRAGKWPVVELYLGEDLPAGEAAAVRRMVRGAVPVHRVPSRRIEQLCHARDHQGYLAKMGEYPYADFEALARAGPGEAPLVLFLDRVQDPYNVGAILRSGEVLGAAGVVLPSRGQCGVNSMVARTSAGAVNRIPVARVEDPLRALAAFRERGFRLAAASQEGDVDVAAYDFRVPVVVILGNEAEGVRPDIAACCHAVLRIPQAGRIGSLNVAAAAAVVCYEALRQKRLPA